jgi:drug/metabolite transporter (DMT)-like permease
LVCRSGIHHHFDHLLNGTDPAMDTAKGYRLGALLAFIAAALFAAVDLAIKHFEPHLSVWDMIMGRSLLGVMAMLVLARWTGTRLLGPGRGAMVVVGLCGSTFIVCLTIAVMLLPLFEALVLVYLFPVFAALFSPRLTGEKISPLDWLLIVLAFGGAVLILWPDQLEVRLRWGHCFGLAAALLNGLTLTLIRAKSTHNTSLVPVFYICLAGCLVFAGPFLAQDAPFHIAPAGILGLLAMGGMATIAYMAISKALTRLASPRVGIIGMAEVLLGGLGGYLLFDETLHLRAILGAALIIGSGICLTLKPE